MDNVKPAPAAKPVAERCPRCFYAEDGTTLSICPACLVAPSPATREHAAEGKVPTLTEDERETAPEIIAALRETGAANERIIDRLRAALTTANAEVERLRGVGYEIIASRIENIKEREAEKKRADKAEAALDTATRALPPEGNREKRLEAAIRWALGEGDSDFGDNMPPNARRYWWRTELRARAFGLPDAPEGKEENRG